jgi:putative MFS transporter
MNSPAATELSRVQGAFRQGSPQTVAARLDRLPSSRYLWVLVALLSFGAFFEIYDIALTAPLSLGLSTVGIFHPAGLFGVADQASFIAATFGGLYLGTTLLAPLADTLGRRAVFTYSLIWYALATFVMGFQNTAPMIDLWRLIAGIGVGMELVAIDSYLAELMPKAIRGRAFAISAAIQFLSAPVVAILSVVVMPHIVLGIAGWRWLCFFPAIGALLIWWVRRGLPESPRWLATRGRESDADRIVCAIEARVAREYGRPLPEPEVVALDVAPVEKGSFADLWRAPNVRRTVVMIVFHLFQTIGYYGFGNWLPTLLVAKGIGVTKSLVYGAAIAFALPVAPFLFSGIADRIERKWQIAIAALLVSVFGLWFATLTKQSPALAIVGLGIGISMSNNLMSYAYHAYQSEIFPTRIRARAVGFVYSFSRLSAALSGYLIAIVLGRAGSTGVFVLISGAMLVVAVTIAGFGPRTKGLAVEAITVA